MNKNSTTKAMTPAAGTPEGKPTSSSRDRLPVPPKQTIGRELVDMAWHSHPQSGGDLDGQPFHRVALGKAVHHGRSIWATWQRCSEHW